MTLWSRFVSAGQVVWCWARDMHVRTQRIVQSRLQSSSQRSQESGYMCSCIRSTLLPCTVLGMDAWILRRRENFVSINHHGMACMHRCVLGCAYHLVSDVV
jgi:hypothetical protein